METGKEQPDSTMNYAPGINSKSMHVFQSFYNVPRIHTVRHFFNNISAYTLRAYASRIKKWKEGKEEKKKKIRKETERDATH